MALCRRDVPCLHARDWLRHEPSPGSPANRAARGRDILARLTGQDEPALSAFVHAVDLYTRADRSGQEHAIAAMRHLALAMQPSVRPLAKEVIACVYDWDERARLWARMFPEGAAVPLEMLAAALAHRLDWGGLREPCVRDELSAEAVEAYRALRAALIGREVQLSLPAGAPTSASRTA